MGILIDIPSGMLWSAIAMVREIPRDMFLLVDIKVIIPSGMLWMMMAIIEMIPIL